MVSGELASLEIQESIVTAENVDLQEKLSQVQEEAKEASEGAENLQGKVLSKNKKQQQQNYLIMESNITLAYI